MIKSFSIILILLLPLTVLNAKTFKGEISSYSSPGCQTLSQKQSPYVSSICVDKVKIKYKLYSMMGEPVEIYAVYWELSPYINLRSGSMLISLMSPEVQEAYAKISLHYKSKFVMSMHKHNTKLSSFRFSGGALKGSAKGYSFDTPGSPSWDKFMLKNTLQDYFSKKETIDIFKSTSELEANFKFEKIENLGFSNLYSLNNALKPKKEKKKEKTQNKQTQTTKVSPSIQAKPTQTKNKATQASYSYSGTTNASLLLLIDVSGSMQGAKLKSAKKAALDSIDVSLQKGVEISILAFSGSCTSPISKRINFSRNKQKLYDFVQNLSAGGGTPLGNALKVANNYLYTAKSSASQTQMIVLLADGDDNCGNISYVMRTLKSKGIIFRHQTIGLEIKANSKAVKQLELIAKTSGGVYHHVKDHKQLPNIFKEALSTMEILDMLGSFGMQKVPQSPTTNSNASMQNLLDQF